MTNIINILIALLLLGFSIFVFYGALLIREDYKELKRTRAKRKEQENDRK